MSVLSVLQSVMMVEYFNDTEHYACFVVAEFPVIFKTACVNFALAA